MENSKIPSMHNIQTKIILVFILAWFTKAGANDCIPRKFGKDQIVCVCNSTYCDATPEISPDPGSFLWYVSSKAGQRMNLTTGKIGNIKEGSTILTLNPEKRYQTIQGFGGAFTDSAGINIQNISNASQQKLLETYFSKTGSRYNLGRIPIGVTDFSTRYYSYDDIPDDVLLENFSLAPEDTKYKIPFVQKALELSPELLFLASSWTAPSWMKTTNENTLKGYLKKEYFQVYTDYLLKFLNGYEKHNIKIWAISSGNEPFAKFVSMGWNSKDLGTFIAKNLGPSLAKSQHNKTMILTLDDQKFFLLYSIKQLFNNKEAEKFVSGIGFHFYTDIVIPTSVLSRTHNRYPEKFLLMTEACEGFYPWQIPKVLLGDWSRGESYVIRMFDNLNEWTTGWVDWNIALDKNGGPNWVDNFVDAPIIVNPETDEFFKQPLYYVIHHFSRFVPRGSVRLELKDSTFIFHSLTSIAFETPQKETVVLIYNKSGSSQKVDIIDGRIGIINLDLPGNSLSTIIYQA